MKQKGWEVPNLNILPDDPKNQYLYNGKEFHDDNDEGLYNYGFRFYDPAIARFTSVDPRAEKYFALTPYAYVANNPLSFIDPRGDTLPSINHNSAERGLDALDTGFNTPSTARLLPQYEADGLTMKSISQGDIQSAMTSLSKEEQLLFKSLSSMINSSYLQTFDD